MKEKVLIQISGEGLLSPLAPLPNYPPTPKFQRPCIEYEDDDDDETTVAVAVRHIVQKLWKIVKKTSVSVRLAFLKFFL